MNALHYGPSLLVLPNCRRRERLDSAAAAALSERLEDVWCVVAFVPERIDGAGLPGASECGNTTSPMWKIRY